MAQNIEQFPIRDKIVREDGYLSDVWFDILGNLFQTLVGYLSANGIFVPKLTTAQRDNLRDVVDGQMIYNTDSNAVEVWNLTAWGMFAPQLTATEIAAINSPLNGQIVYNETTNKFQGREAGVWVNFV